MNITQKVKAIKQDIRELNIDAEGTMTFKAAVIILFGLEHSVNPNVVAKRTGYDPTDVKFIINNLRAQGILKGKNFIINFANEETNIYELVLCAMVGAGTLAAVIIEEFHTNNIVDDSILSPDPSIADTEFRIVKKRGRPPKVKAIEVKVIESTFEEEQAHPQYYPPQDKELPVPREEETIQEIIDKQRARNNQPYIFQKD